MIYIFVGKSCSGKTTARNIIEKRYGYEGYEASTIVKHTLIKNKMKSIWELYNKLGKDFVAKEILLHANSTNIAISGLRTTEEICLLKKERDTTVIDIYASDKVCFKRSLDRNRPGSFTDFANYYRNTICADYSLGLAQVIEQFTDYVIDNSSENISNLETQLQRIVVK